MKNTAGAPVIVYNPFSTRALPAGGFVRDPFPGTSFLRTSLKRTLARGLRGIKPACPYLPGGPAIRAVHGWVGVPSARGGPEPRRGTRSAKRCRQG